MFKITIDGKTTTVPDGSTILDAARELGIEIPTFCDHKHLRPFGACRICVVEVEGARGLLPACTAPVSHGMEVNTHTERVRNAREAVLELLLTYHPLDCPVCPQSGRCELQDQTFKHGKDEGRFGSGKAEVRVDYLSPLIENNQTRCIQCGRCVRICDEVQAEGELDFTERGFETVISPSFGKVMDCEFCGQCIQVCPVGALYSRIYKHTTPSWELTPVRTTCPFCGVGCTLNLEVKGNRAYHVLGADDEGANNEGFLCAKGRFGYEYIGHPDRLSKPMVRKGGKLQETTWEEAYQAVVDGFSKIMTDGGGKALGGIASARCTNEENYLLQKLMRTVLDSDNIDSVARFSHVPALEALYMAFGTAAPTDSLADLEDSDLIFALDANVTEDAHIAGLKVLRKVRFGEGKLIVANPRKVKLARFAETYLPMNPGTAVALVNSMINVILEEGLEDKEYVASKVEGIEELRKSVQDATPEKTQKVTGVPADEVREAARAIAASQAMTILLSPMTTSYTGTDTVTAAANLALITGNVGKAGSGILPLSEYNNVQGVMDMGAMPGYLPGHVPSPGDAGLTAMEMVEAALAGTLKGLYVMGENPLTAFPDPAKVSEALKKLQFLVVQDIFLTETAAMADVVLPATTGPEKDGTFTNTDRRVQRVRKALDPPGKARADWKILADLFEAFGKPVPYRSPMEVTKAIAGEVPAYAGIVPERLEADGLHWPCPDRDHPGTPYLYADGFAGGRAAVRPVQQQETGNSSSDYPLTLVSGTILFHSGTTTKWSKGLNDLAPVAQLQIHPEAAAEIEVEDGDRVRVTSRAGEVEAVARVTTDVGKGVVFLPSHYPGAPAGSLIQYDPVKEKTVSRVAVSKAGGPGGE